MVIVLSVQHTGTRFTCSFLESIGVLYRQYHSTPYDVDDIRHEKLAKALIPVRDPLLAFTSMWLRQINPDTQRALKSVILQYKLLEQIKTWFDCEYLRLDAKDHGKELKKVAKYCGYDGQIDFEWEPIGNRKPTATDYVLWDLISEDWGKEKEDVLAALKPYRAIYGY